MDASPLPVTATLTQSPLWQFLRDDRALIYAMVLCNPVLVLHFINGLLSLLYPNAMRSLEFDTWIKPHMDVHSQDDFCRFFTVLMVALQSAIYAGHTSKIDCGHDSSNSNDTEDAENGTVPGTGGEVGCGK